MDENYMYQYGYNYNENPEFSIDNLPGRSNFNPTKQNYPYNQFSSTYNPNHNNRKIKTPYNGNQLPPNKNNFLQKTQTKEEVPKFENHDFPALGKTANKTTTKKDVPNLKNEDFPSLTKSSNNPNNNTSNNNNNNNNSMNNLLIDNNSSHNNLVIDNNNNQKNPLDYDSENTQSSFQNPQIFDDPNQYNDMMHSNPETAFYYQMQQQQMQQQYQQDQIYEYQQQQIHQQQLHQQQQHQINPNNKNSGESDDNQKYCLIELQPVIRMTNPDLNLLSVGQDLTILGLELNSRECLYETFISPWFNETSKNIPSFLINDHITIAPPSKKLDLFTDETLFYMFYTHTNDSLQIHVSRELHKRKWRYHKFLQSWIRGGSNENEKTDTYEKGTFEFFDTNAWEKISKENFVIENSAIEEIPPSDL